MPCSPAHVSVKFLMIVKVQIHVIFKVLDETSRLHVRKTEDIKPRFPEFILVANNRPSKF